MTSKLKCPVCNVPLTECGDLLFCPNDHCAWAGNAELWNAFIQATQALEKIVSDYEVDASNGWLAANAKQALEQIEHKEI